MREIKSHTTLYWEIPDELTEEQMIELLQQLPLNRVLELVTGSLDLNYEVNE
jgi:hypothetical protein